MRKRLIQILASAGTLLAGVLTTGCITEGGVGYYQSYYPPPQFYGTYCPPSVMSCPPVHSGHHGHGSHRGHR